MSLPNTTNKISTSNYSRSLLGDLDKLILDQLDLPDLAVERIPTMLKGSGKKAIEVMNSQGDPYAYLRREGSDFEFYTQGEGYTTLTYVQYYQLNKMITQELEEHMQIPELLDFLEDEGGQKIVKKMSGMAVAMRQTKNKTFCQFLSLFQSASQPFGDGKPLASTTQPLVAGGTFSNLNNAAPPDPEVVQQLINAQSIWLNHSGRTIRVMPRMLFGGTNLRFLFDQILTSKGQLNSNYNNRNLIEAHQDEYMPEKFCVDPEYPNDNSWCIINNIPEGDGLLTFMHKEFESQVRDHPFSWDKMIVSQAAWVHSVGLKHATNWVAGY